MARISISPFKWRLSLDLGTGSIGWVALDIADPETPAILDMGVRIFPDGREVQQKEKGTPLNEGRRDARMMRRQRDRKIRRKRAMLGFLTANGLMPPEPEKQREAAALDPYLLRSEALERELAPFELGRIMMQFAIRRGFKSNRKDLAERGNEQKGMLGGISALEAALGGLTLGQWLHRQHQQGKPVRFAPRMEKTTAVYEFYPSREMYEAEFAAIREKQEQHYPGPNWDRLHWLIFFQRPLKRPERGRCRFYTEEDRGYRAFPSAHRFRILQELHNLAYYNEENRLEEIPWELKLRLFQALDTQKSLTFDKARKILGADYYTGSFNLEDSRRDKLNGNETSVDFRKPEYFGSQWDGLPFHTQDAIVEELILEEDEEKLAEYLKQFNLSEEQIKKLSGYHFSTGTMMCSSKFMIDCSRVMLDEKLPYAEAVAWLGLHHSDKAQGKIQKSLPYYGKILTSLVTGAKGESAGGNAEERYGRIANPTVHIALNQTRKLVNVLIRRFGNPSEVIMELARELKLSREKKAEVYQQQTKNQKENERIKGELAEHGRLQPNHGDIRKYKLWEELGTERNSRCCPYCGKNICAKDLLSGDIEVEHIIPYSRSLLGSMDNLTVAHRRCNQEKGNRSPFEAFGNDAERWQKIEDAIAKLPFRKRRKFFPDAMKHFNEEEGGFLAKQLTDTAYLSRAAKDYLSAICSKNSIWVSPGRLTANLRALWGFNTLLNRSHDTWFKNRNDHRHHALDALVIGLCTRRLVAEAARVNSNRGYVDLIAPPCPVKRQDIEQRLKAMLISYKPDHGREGKLYAETALAKHSYIEEIAPGDLREDEVHLVIPKSIRIDITALVKAEGFRKARKTIEGKYKFLRVFRDKWVTRAPLESLSDRDIPNVADPLIRTDLQAFIAEHGGKVSPEILAEFGREHRIYSIRYFPKDQVPVPIGSCNNKAYMPGDFYRVDIWRIPPAKGAKGKGAYKYEGVFISRPEAVSQTLRGEDAAPPRKPHPAAKLVMQLCKHDIIELAYKEGRELCRVTGYSTTQNKIDIQPLYASNTISSWMKDTHTGLTSTFWPYKCEGHYFKSINALFSEYEVRLVKITVDGRLFYR